MVSPDGVRRAPKEGGDGNVRRETVAGRGAGPRGAGPLYRGRSVWRVRGAWSFVMGEGMQKKWDVVRIYVVRSQPG